MSPAPGRKGKGTAGLGSSLSLSTPGQLDTEVPHGAAPPTPAAAR